MLLWEEGFRLLTLHLAVREALPKAGWLCSHKLCLAVMAAVALWLATRRPAARCSAVQHTTAFTHPRPFTWCPLQPGRQLLLPAGHNQDSTSCWRQCNAQVSAPVVHGMRRITTVVH